jgi:hypothetical protein
MREHGISGLADPKPDPPPAAGSAATAGIGTLMGDGGYWVGIPATVDAHSPAFVRRITRRTQGVDERTSTPAPARDATLRPMQGHHRSRKTPLATSEASALLEATPQTCFRLREPHDGCPFDVAPVSSADGDLS